MTADFEFFAGFESDVSPADFPSGLAFPSLFGRRRR